ncbi:hypothetical protein [Verrucosispora sp. TAA-831]
MLWLASDNKGWPTRTNDNTATVAVDNSTTCINLVDQAAIHASPRA